MCNCLILCFSQSLGRSRISNLKAALRDCACDEQIAVYLTKIHLMEKDRNDLKRTILQGVLSAAVTIHGLGAAHSNDSGKSQGESETKKKTALIMLQDGELSIKKIARYSGLEIEEVERLAGSQTMQDGINRL